MRKKEMIKRFEFIEKIIYLLRKELEENLPEESSLDDMFSYLEKTFKKLLKGN
jgi:hypothetical protein